MTGQDDAIDRTIDAAAGDLTAGEPSPDFTRQVMVRLDTGPARPRRWPAWGWPVAIGAAATVTMAVLALMARPPASVTLAPAPIEIATAPPAAMPVLPPVAESEPAALTATPAAAAPDLEPLPELDLIAIAPIALEPIVIPTAAIARLEIGPLVVDPLEVPPMEEAQ
jgi:hypothetical protein